MLKIAHRGASGYAPENTMIAFKKAFLMGADAIEFDIHNSADGELVCIHDETLDRTTNGSGLVKDFTIAELKKLDAGHGEKIPTLEEVLDLCGTNKTAFIELKEEGTAVKTVEIIKKYVKEKLFDINKLIVISFNLDKLSFIKKNYPEIVIGATFEDYDFKLDEAINIAKKLKSYSINLSLKCVNKKNVKAIKDEGFKIFVWTAKTKEDVKFLSKFDIDGIMCDYPDLLDD